MGAVLACWASATVADANLAGRHGAGAEASAWRWPRLAVWQAVVVVLTLLASALFGGRLRDVLALRPPPADGASICRRVLLMAAAAGCA